MQDIFGNHCNSAFLLQMKTHPHSQVEEYSKQPINHKYRTNISVQLKIINANAEGISD